MAAKKPTKNSKKTSPKTKIKEDSETSSLNLKEEVKEEKEPELLKKEEKVETNKNVGENKEKEPEEKLELKESDREGFYNFENTEEYTSDFDTLIENNRVSFTKVIRRDRIVRTIVILVALGLVIFSLVYVLRVLENKALGFSLIAVAALMMILYLGITKGTTASLSSEYLNSFYTNTSLKFFEDSQKYNGLTINPKGSTTKEDFEVNGAFSNISRIVSRNDVSFSYKGNTNVKICDLAAFSIGKDKYERPVFVGKYLTVPNNYQNENPIYIYLKGYKFALPPTAIDEVSKVYNTENVMIQTENKEYKKNLSDEIVGILDKYVCNNVLLDGTIIIKKNITYFCLGYSDEFGVIPFKTKFNPGPYKQYLNDLDLFLEINSKIK